MSSKQPTNRRHGGTEYSIPGSGRSPGEWYGNPLQYSCLGNPMDKRSLVACSPWGCKESDMTDRVSNNSQVFWWPLPQPNPNPREDQSLNVLCGLVDLAAVRDVVKCSGNEWNQTDCWAVWWQLRGSILYVIIFWSVKFHKSLPDLVPGSCSHGRVNSHSFKGEGWSLKKSLKWLRTPTSGFP